VRADVDLDPWNIRVGFGRKCCGINAVLAERC
jgi:hypothetical protein